MPINTNSNMPASKEVFDEAYRRVKIAFQKTEGNKVKMAKVLGISYHSVLQALRIYEKLGKRITLKKSSKVKKIDDAINR